MKAGVAAVIVLGFMGSVHAGEVWREAPSGVPRATILSLVGRDASCVECFGYADATLTQKVSGASVVELSGASLPFVKATELAAAADGVAKLTEPIGDEMAKRLFRPLGMSATAWVKSERGEVLRTTADDLAKFARMLAAGGTASDGSVVISAAAMKAWASPDGTLALDLGEDAWGEVNVRTHRARLFLAPSGGASVRTLRNRWKTVAPLDSAYFGYPSFYLEQDRLANQRKALTKELWKHDAKAETKLWPAGKVPFRKNDKPLRFVENELWQRNLVVTDINDPFFVFYPTKAAAPAPVAVVLPGGGYSVLGWNKEGTEIAEWLNANGYSAAVLLYRAPDQRAAALCDVQRTIGLLRRDAAVYGIDPKRVGVIGFSAGANLAVAASTNWRKRGYGRVDEADDLPCRPDFQLPIYLWDVLGRDPDSEDIMPLLGRDIVPKLRAEYPVDAETPPAFLAQAKDDFCQIETSVVYYQALVSAGVKDCRFVPMAKGGHGYGLRRVGNPTDGWSDEAAAWLKELLK